MLRFFKGATYAEEGPCIQYTGLQALSWGTFSEVGSKWRGHSRFQHLISKVGGSPWPRFLLFFFLAAHPFLKHMLITITLAFNFLESFLRVALAENSLEHQQMYLYFSSSVGGHKKSSVKRRIFFFFTLKLLHFVWPIISL